MKAMAMLPSLTPLDTRAELIQHFSYRISFLSLGAIAALAFVLLWTAIPETLTNANERDKNTSSPGTPKELST
jgi:predicted MFS family arabinose efflux permease